MVQNTADLSTYMSYSNTIELAIKRDSIRQELTHVPYVAALNLNFKANLCILYVWYL